MIQFLIKMAILGLVLLIFWEIFFRDGWTNFTDSESFRAIVHRAKDISRTVISKVKPFVENPKEKEQSGPTILLRDAEQPEEKSTAPVEPDDSGCGPTDTNDSPSPAEPSRETRDSRKQFIQVLDTRVELNNRLELAR